MQIEISTPFGRVFEGDVSSMEFRTDKGMCVEIRPSEVQYLNLIKDGEITLIIGREAVAFQVTNASSRFAKGRLAILAASAKRTSAAPEQAKS